MAEQFRALINGEWVASGTRGTFENINPADNSDVVGTFPKCGREEVEAAVASAKEAQKAWALVPAPRRGEIIKRCGDILAERKEDLARLMTREMGKILAETRGDVQEAIDTAYMMAGEGRRMYGDTVPCELPNKFGMSIRCPIGVAVMITPWNFPMAIPSWKIFPALVCGNTVVLKPATDTPASSARFVEALLDAGLPPKCIHLVYGSGRDVGETLATHPDVGVVSFTGSSEVGKRLAAVCGERLKRLSLELGGKNPQIVMEDANLELAVEGALWGAFGTTGQRCTATSRLIVHRDVREEFTSMLVARAKELKIGNGLDDSVQMGPCINAAQRDSVHGYVEIGKAEGARMLCGGHALTDGEYAKGSFYAPTVFADVTPKMRIFQEEIFGPVVGITEVSSFEEAIAVANDCTYGLSSSIYTRDVNRAFRAMRDIQAGITYINGPTIGAEVGLPFGGVKNTGNGHRESGHQVLDIFTEWKSVYVDFSGRLQRAQIDTEALSG
ncbi:MAG: aldehyde dehydrogenase family protein [Fimbriimonadia bacterium]|jgi:aldehyde dehydrogenase (NAD+)